MPNLSQNSNTVARYWHEQADAENRLLIKQTQKRKGFYPLTVTYSSRDKANGEWL